MNNDEYLRLLNHKLKENDDWYQQTAKLLGMSDSTFWILYMLYDYPEGITQSEICSMSYFPKQTINSSLKKLEADGVIELVPGNNGRSKKIVLTASGNELMSRTIVKVRRAECNAHDSMTAGEKDAFITIIDKFTQHLNDATYLIKK